MEKAVKRNLQLLRRLLRAKDRIDASPDKAWTVAELASISGVSEAHFARSFSAAFGIPPHRYLLTRRIERAATLLRDTHLPVTEVAVQVGWDSLGTFGRTFRDVVGENPTALRRRLAGQNDAIEQVPYCFVSAAQRPNLKTAVLEKRRLMKGAT